MSMYTLSFLCALAVFTAVQVPGTLAFFSNCGSSSKNNVKKGGNRPSSSHVNEIVNKHNALRRGVQPTASNMLKMSWSKEAAANAQRWANTCSMKHSPRDSRKLSTAVERTCPGPRARKAGVTIQSWYNEVKDWRYGVGAANGKKVGHYTQVVWYRSNKVGCGMAYCPNSQYKYFYVCQYCPPGNKNVDYRYPYKQGSPCGDCPNACDSRLCTNPCPNVDMASNCLKYKWACNRSAKVASMCAATCTCTTEIK